MPCQNPRNFEQIPRKQNFCRMYGLAVMLVVSRSKLHPSIPIVVYISCCGSLCLSFHGRMHLNLPQHTDGNIYSIQNHR